MLISRPLFYLIWILCISNVISIPLVWPEVLDAMRLNAVKMEEFIKYLGIPSIKFCHAEEEDDGLPPMFNKDLDFGDLLLDKNDQENGSEDTEEEQDFSSGLATPLEPASGKVSASSKRKWENGIVPYYISNDYSADQRQTIEKAISDMNTRIRNVQFRPFNRLTDKNYVLIFSGKGCFSKLGMLGGQQPVSLQAGKCLKKKGIIQHELTHALGFSHEHNRPDRNQHIVILPDNIPKDWLKNYELNSPKEAAYVGRYDFYSAMHYPPQAPETENKLAFEVLDSSVDIQEIGNREELSDLDVQKIEEFYDVGNKDLSDRDVQKIDEFYDVSDYS